jgi:hypothetical protein
MKEGAIFPRIIEINLLRDAPSAKVDTVFCVRMRLRAFGARMNLIVLNI